MLQIHHFNLEIFAKSLAKFSGVFKQSAVILLIGVSSDLDAFYVATSVCGLILALIAWSEVVILPELSSVNDGEERQVLFVSLFKLTTMLGMIVSLVAIVSGYFLYGETYLQWLCLLSIWAILNVVNNFFILLYRVQGKVEKVASYYLITSISGAAIFIALSSIFLYFDIQLSLVWLLVISILLPELYLVVKNLSVLFSSQKKIKQKACISWSIFFKKYILSHRSISVLWVILLVFGIDATDKYFTTIESVLPIGASILVYGSLIPLTLRNALDAKSLFYTTLQKTSSAKQQVKLLLQTLYKVMWIYIPISIVGAILCYLIGSQLLKLVNVSIDDSLMIIKVFYIYLMLIPFYILWDFLYRIYHFNSKVKTVSLLITIGFVLNILLNYYFVFSLSLGAAGIAFSTLLVYVFYCSIGLVSLIKNNKVYKNHENFNC